MKSELLNDLKKYEEALRRKTNETGATSLLGLILVSLEKGHVVFTMRIKPRHKQIHGVVHGGVLGDGRGYGCGHRGVYDRPEGD